MDSFIPTLVATFLGVCFSFATYRVWEWYKNSKIKKDFNRFLLEEINYNRKTLLDLPKEVIVHGVEVEPFNAPRLRMGVYEIAFRNGQLRLLGNMAIQQKLAEYVENCEFYNCNNTYGTRDSQNCNG